jgi:hypothetical protein
MKAEFKISKEKNRMSLTVTGDLIAQAGEQFKEQLHQLMDGIAMIQLSLKHVSAIDVSSIQLIKGFRTALDGTEKKVQILPPDSNELIELLNKTGLVGVIQTIH